MYRYKVEVTRVVDGDTVDVDVDLGFGMVYKKQRVRMMGIDTPESRTRNKAEKVLGLAAKEFLTQQCRNTFTVASMGRGKFGRILGIIYSENGLDICKLMIKPGHAVEYYGGKKTKVWA